MGLEAGAIAAIASTVIGAGTAVMSYEERRSAERDQEKAQKASQSQAQVENARQRRRAIAQQRIAAARNEAQQASGAVEGSSMLTGVQGSLTSQLGSNISGQRRQVQGGILQGNLMQSAQNKMGRAQTIQSVGNLGMNLAQNTNWESLGFGGN